MSAPSIVVAALVLLLPGWPGTAGAAGPGPALMGRVSAVEGDMQVSYGEGPEAWEPAAINYPVAPGARIFVGPFGRAEIRVGPNGFRLGGQAVLDVVTLEDRSVQLSLHEGALNLALRDVPPDGLVEVATPGMLIAIRTPGSYRIDADPAAQATRASVRSGEAQVSSGDRGILLNAGRAVAASASGLEEYDAATAYGLDDFDRWCYALSAEAGGAYSGYVPPAVTGYEMLDRSGTWGTYSGYGTAWTPGNAYGWWAPYTYGRWAWVPPWGWTWVDDAPWAFTTFRFGRWTFLNGQWWWVPGTLRSRPVFTGFVPLHPGQINFTSAFFVRGKPAQHFVPLNPGPFTAKRPLYWWPQALTRPSTARAVPGAAMAPRSPGSAGGMGAGGLPAGVVSPRIAPRTPMTRSLPSPANAPGGASSGRTAPAVPGQAAPAGAAPAPPRGPMTEGSAAAAPPAGTDAASAGTGAAPDRGDSAAPTRRGFQGRDSGTGGARRPIMPSTPGTVRNHFHHPSPPAAMWGGFTRWGNPSLPFLRNGSGGHSTRQRERR